jgi:hypothetical protein
MTRRRRLLDTVDEGLPYGPINPERRVMRARLARAALKKRVAEQDASTEATRRRYSR